MASFVHMEMRRHGVVLRLGETVTGFRQDGDSVLTLLGESEPLRSDMVLLAIGVTPDTHLAKEAGLELGIRFLLDKQFAREFLNHTTLSVMLHEGIMLLGSTFCQWLLSAPSI